MHCILRHEVEEWNQDERHEAQAQEQKHRSQAEERVNLVLHVRGHFHAAELAHLLHRSTRVSDYDYAYWASNVLSE